MSSFDVTTGYVPGSIGRVAELHAQYYAEHWDFGLFFEAKVATELGDFIGRYDEAKDCIWLLSVDGTIEGSSQDVHIAHLRWFIVSDPLRGKGAGNYLMRQALTFCEEKGYDAVCLWTFEGLDPARHLYEKYGFRLVEERSGTQWGTPVMEQRFEAALRRV
ncbi:MAG: GNAT family N-acetyltransferase [Deltaproteobacteria bacterium]|nr:GNAT family N-acetyltransferase [Deltaproteobacteria bacterium]